MYFTELTDCAPKIIQGLLYNTSILSVKLGRNFKSNSYCKMQQVAQLADAAQITLARIIRDLNSNTPITTVLLRLILTFAQAK